MNHHLLGDSLECLFKIDLERVRRIELPYAAWEAAVLPLNYTRFRDGSMSATTANRIGQSYLFRRVRQPVTGRWSEFLLGFPFQQHQGVIRTQLAQLQLPECW